MLIDGVKYACTSCIRGHRQTSCQHGDRPLTEIHRRGRPATACERCREARKIHNSHKTCTHHDELTGPVLAAPIPRQLPQGAPTDLLRRSSSQQSRSSASSAPPPAVRKPPASAASSAALASASTSASAASEEELAVVGRKKSLSRPPSSRRSSSAAQKKPSKPHDLAHGHLADHPTHVSTSFSPYSHHHHPHAAAKAGIKPEPQTPAMAYPSLPSLAAPSKAATPPSPASAYSTSASAALPVLPPPAVQERKMTNEELASAFFFRGFPPPTETCGAAPAMPPTPLPAPPVPAHVEALPPALPAPETQTPVPAPRTLPQPIALPLPPPPLEFQQRLPTPPPAQPILTQPTSTFDSYPQQPFSTSPETAYPDGFPMSDSDPPSTFPLPLDIVSGAPASYEEDLFPIDPAMAAFVLGPANGRTTVALAPAYGQDEVFSDEPEGYPQVVVGSSSGQPLYAFATPASVPDPLPSSSNGENFPYASTSSDSLPANHYFNLADSGTLPPPNPAIYGFPLHPVDSHTSYASYNSYTSSSHDQASYSGYESAASAASVSNQSVTGGAATALERLNLDLDPFSGNNSASYHSSEASSLAAGQVGMGGGVQTSSSSAAATDVEGDTLGQTEIDGILEWLASSATAGEFPHPPPSASSAAATAFPPPAPPPSRASDRPSLGHPPSLSSFSSSFSGAGGLGNAGYSSGFASSASSLQASRNSPHFPTSTFFEPASSSSSSSALRPPYHNASAGLSSTDSIPAYPNQHSSYSLAFASAAPPSPVPIAVDEAGYEEDDEAEEAEPAVLRARENTAPAPVASTSSLAFAGADGGDKPGSSRRRRKRDPGLEMMRTATITCADQAGAEEDEEDGDEDDDDEEEDEADEEEDDEEEDGEEEEEEDDSDSGGGLPPESDDDDDVEARFRRGGFAARFGLDGGGGGSGVRVGEDELGLDEDDLERFGIDEDWLRRLGTQEVHLDFADGEGGAGGSAGRGNGQGSREEMKREDKIEEEEEAREPGGFTWWS